MKSYQNSWDRYCTILAANFGIRMTRAPSETWQKVRGHKIHIDVWEPNAPPKGTLILVHGAGGHGRVLAPAADFAASMGWRALAPDLPGYGLTQPASDYSGDYGEWPAIIAQIADETEGPVVLMGLSVGGITATFAAEIARNVDGVIATTLLDMGDPETFVKSARWRWLGAISRIGFRLIPGLLDRLSLPVWLVAPMRSMSTDPAMSDYFSRDPFLGGLWVKLRFFRTLHARKAPTLSLACPFILIHPGADKWTPTAMSLPAFNRLKAAKTMIELSNGSHLPLEEPAFKELKTHVSQFLDSLSPPCEAKQRP